MIVENVSPTPFALLRRAKNFEYRDDDWHLQEFANYEDPISALTDECLRVLKCISSANQSSVSSTKQSTSLRDASWSRFEDIGFGGSIDSDTDEEKEAAPPATAKSGSASQLSAVPQSGEGDLGRPTTPSWADFMSSGFGDENNMKSHVGPLLLPPDKVLPPIAAVRGQSSQSHKRSLDIEPALEPAELASINTIDMDDSFWWVWISSLSGDEPSSRKAVFGRCALLETVIRNTKWLVLEEQVKGAAPEPEAGAQIVEKKRFFSFGSRKGKLNRRKSSAKKVSSIEESYKRPNNQAPQSKTSIGPDQHKRIQAAAAALQKKHREQEAEAKENRANADTSRQSTKTNSVMTLQPAILDEASQAMKWTKKYDKGAFRAAYLSDTRAGTGQVDESEAIPEPASEVPEEKPTTPLPPLPTNTSKTGPPPPPPKVAAAAVSTPLPPSPKQEPKKIVKVPTPEEEKSITEPAVVEQPAERRESVDEASKKLKKKTGNSGFKSMFGAKKKPDQQQPPLKNTGAKENSAVAAARAALEAKTKAAQESGPVKKKPLPKESAIVTAPVAAEVEKPSTPKIPEQPVAKPPTPTKPPASVGENGAPPKTRRAVEYDALSRVATHERDAADQEFSKFDQGPFTEQPAFVPEDSPVSPVPAAQKTELPRTPMNGNGVRPDSATSPVSTDVTQDRWKAIREAAAQRTAAAQEQEHEPETETNTRTSHSERTDEGDTSGEESEYYLIFLEQILLN